MSDAFLDRLVGRWTYDGHSLPEDGKRRRGVETVSRRGRWLVIEDGEDARFQLAFDPETGRVTGDFVNWEHPQLWTYDGAVEGDRMTLASRGPGFDEEGALADYQDVWELVSADERVLTGRLKGADGAWRDFSTTRYRRET